MSDLLKVQRNDSCPCGSGKKYKKCCLQQVEELEKRWQKEGYFWFTPEFRQALAMVCGLAQQQKEEGNDQEDVYYQLKEGLDELGEKFFEKQSEIKAVDEYISHLMKVFNDLLTKNPFYQEMRLSLQQGMEVLRPANKAMLDAGTGEGDEQEKEKMQAALQEAIRTWLVEQIDQQANDWFVLSLMKGLQRPSYSLDERSAQLLALYLALQKKPEENDFWDILVRVVLQETYQVIEQLDKAGLWKQGLQKAEQADQSAQEKMDELMKQNPTYRLEIIRKINETAKSAQDLIARGRLRLHLAPYAVLGGLLAVREVLAGQDIQAGEPGKEGTFTQRLADKVQSFIQTLQENELMEMVTKNWVEDYDLFIATMRQYLEQWLHEEGREMSQQERDQVRHCREILGSGHEGRLSFFCYIVALVSFLETIDGVLEVDNSRLEKETGMPAVEFLTSAGLEQYAKSLENEEKPDAARHVRSFQERVGQK